MRWVHRDRSLFISLLHNSAMCTWDNNWDCWSLLTVAEIVLVSVIAPSNCAGVNMKIPMRAFKKNVVPSQINFPCFLFYTCSSLYACFNRCTLCLPPCCRCILFLAYKFSVTKDTNFVFFKTEEKTFDVERN